MKEIGDNFLKHLAYRSRVFSVRRFRMRKIWRVAYLHESDMQKRWRTLIV